MHFTFYFLLTLLIEVTSICPLQDLHDMESANPSVNSFHNADGTSEIGSYGSSYFSKSYSSGTSESMGAVERSGMSRTDKESMAHDNSCQKGMYSASGASWGSGNVGAFGRSGMDSFGEKNYTAADLGAFKNTRSLNNEGYGNASISGIGGYKKLNKTHDPSGLSWGSAYSGAFGKEGMLNTRGSSWKTGNTGSFGQMEILRAEGPLRLQASSGAFGGRRGYVSGAGYFGSFGDSEKFGSVGMSGLYGSLGLTGMIRPIGYRGMNGSLSNARMYSSLGFPYMYDALARVKIHQQRALMAQNGRIAGYGMAANGAAYGMYGALASGQLHKERDALLANKGLEVTGHGGLYGEDSNIGERLSVNGLRTRRLLSSRGFHHEAICPHHAAYMGFRLLDHDIY